MLRCFIGWDPRQPVSYHVLSHSILKHAKKPVSIAPLKIEHMPIKRTGLTPFTYSRFLVPYLCGYEGFGLFLDADIMARADVTELGNAFAGYNHDNAVAAVDTGKEDSNLAFERAAVLLFNCEHKWCRQLTPEFVEQAKSLHTLIDWAHDKIVYVEKEWNHLVGYQAENPNAKLVHFTQGIPAYPETQDVEYADEWRQNFREAVSTVPWEELMGRSVHAKPVKERIACGS